ncbi:MMPL family transporter (plasmid) [Streptomyces sp. BI20]|uniref:MMPL family transporter n=1 Tax=Streptomyces sp. BI20 TaxID=3403460 RepID=UPI003C76F313
MSPPLSSPPPRTRSARPWTLLAFVLIALWMGVGGLLGPYAGRLGEVSVNDQAAFLPRDAESTRVLRQEAAFGQSETLPVILVWTARGSGERLAPSVRAEADRVLGALAPTTAQRLAGRPSPALPSEDGRALRAVVPLRPDLGPALRPTLDALRESAGAVPGTVLVLAGPAAAQADLSTAFTGIDGLLLGVALAAVLVILLLVYRSVLLPFLIILGSVFALALACAIVYALAARGVVRVDGQVQGILSILVIGAATDYALLLTTRFREELGVRADRVEALRIAVRRSAGPVLAGAATVALGLVALLLSGLTNNRALGPVGAIGIACAALSALTFLPAVLLPLGRVAYWPARVGPRRPLDAEGSTDADRVPGADAHPVWRRIADLVDRAPRRVWVSTLVVLTACAAFAPGLSAKGVPFDEIFVNDAPSVTAQRVLGEHFPAGSGSPAVVIAHAADPAEVARLVTVVEGVSGVDSVTVTGDGPGGRGGAPRIADGRVRLDVTLAHAADGDAAKADVLRLRAALAAEPGAQALVGGPTARQLDTQRTAEADRDLIVPVVLGIILVILVGLLRSVLLPVLLVATVALNFFATLGVSALVFTHVFGFSGTDASVPLYGFVFLVALGVDYNIFLMSRVREETLRHGTREGLRRGLTATGGVITSAGVVLAATFAALAVIPLAFLVQIAFIVALGVLLDTLVVRSLLVPALVRDLDERVWWPGRPGPS